MNRFELLVRILVIFLIKNCTSSETTSLTIKIDETISLENCSKIIANLEILSSQMSSKLYHATDGLFTINHYNILLPESWSKSSTCLQSRTVTQASVNPKLADIFVTKSFAKPEPWAIQYGGCGVKGDRVLIPSVQLSQMSSSTSSFVNQTFIEIVEYMFGVFLDGQKELVASECDNLVDNLCEDSYDRDSSTKQNLLCDNQSPVERILMKATNATQKLGLFGAPTFSYHTTSANLVILVIDRMMNNDSLVDWELIQNAFFLMISKLEPGSALSIITYGSEATLNLAPTLVTRDNSAELFAKIPRRFLPMAVDFSESCTKCGYEMALKIAESSRLTPTIVLASKIPFHPTEKDYGVLPVTFSIGLTSMMAQPQIPADVHFYSLPDCQEKWICTFQLSKILSSVLNQISRQELVAFHQSNLEVVNSNPVSGYFKVDPSLNENLWVVLVSNDENDFEMFELTDPNGRRYQFPKYEHGFVYFKIEGENPSGRWSYNIKTYDSAKKTIQLEILASKSTKNNLVLPENDISVSGWSHVDSNDASKVYLYAKVLNNNTPLRIDEVSVEAIIYRPAMDPVVITLRDAGTGYPDIRSHDGVFSAYFTKFSPEPGYYFVEIRVKGNHFSRNIVANSFYYEQATGFYLREDVSNPINDVFPPSRITDLKVEGFIEESLFVSLSWTSPGGDFDEGRAYRYEIRCSTNSESLRNSRYIDESILVDASLVPSPADFGIRQDCTVGVPWEGQTFYYAVMAFDEMNNRGLISNVVSIRIDRQVEQPAVTQLPFVDQQTSTDPPKFGMDANTNNSDYAVIAYVACSLLVALAVISVAIWRTIAIMNKRSEQDPEGSHCSSDKNNSNVTTDDIWSVTSSAADDANKTKTSLHFEAENKDNLHSEMIYQEYEISKDFDILASLKLAPRVSLLEDMSVYRDLSNLDSQSLDYFTLSQKLSILLYAEDKQDRKESLV